MFEGTITLEAYEHRKLLFDNYNRNFDYIGYDISELYHKTPNIPAIYAVGKNLCLVAAYKTGLNSKFGFEHQFHFFSKKPLLLSDEYINIKITTEDNGNELKKENKNKPLEVEFSDTCDINRTLAKILTCRQTQDKALWCITAVVIGLGIEQNV